MKMYSFMNKIPNSSFVPEDENVSLKIPIYIHGLVFLSIYAILEPSESHFIKTIDVLVIQGIDALY